MFCYKTKVNEIQCLQLFAVFQKVFLFSPIFCCMMVVSAGRSVTDPFCFLPGLYTYCCRTIMVYVALLFFFFVLVPVFDWYQMVWWWCDLFLSWMYLMQSGNTILIFLE